MATSKLHLDIEKKNRDMSLETHNSRR